MEGGLREPLDWELAIQRTGAGEQIMMDLARLFLEEGPRLMEKLREAVGDGRCPDISSVAHTLKGTVDVFAAGRARELAFRMEQLGRDESLSEAREALSALEQEMKVLQAALQGRIFEQGQKQGQGAEP